MELDIAQLITWGKGIFAAILALVAAITAGPSVVSAMRSKLATAPTIDLLPVKKESKPESDLVDVSSDKLPPVGFIEHAKMIVESSPFATSDVQLGYVTLGLTEAQVLRAEVTRMGSNTTPVKEVKS